MWWVGVVCSKQQWNDDFGCRDLGGFYLNEDEEVSDMDDTLKITCIFSSKTTGGALGSAFHKLIFLIICTLPNVRFQF